MVKISDSSKTPMTFGAGNFACQLRPVTYELRNSFGVNHGTLNHVDMIQIHITDGTHTGRGEARLYKAYDETFEQSSALLKKIEPYIFKEMVADDIISLLPAGATRNAFDLALLDFHAQRDQMSISHILGLPDPAPVRCTDLTISVGTPESMRQELKDFLRQQSGARESLRIKIKMGGLPTAISTENAVAIEQNRIKAVTSLLSSPSEYIVDANEGWTAPIFEKLIPTLHEHGIAVVEQPLPRGQDKKLTEIFSSTSKYFSVIADESFHNPDDLESLLPHYDGFNIKLDKMGGLTTSLQVAAIIKSHGKKQMVGCMVGSSLALAPVFWLAQQADWADVDGATYLKQDHKQVVHLQNGIAYPAGRDLWGYPRA